MIANDISKYRAEFGEVTDCFEGVPAKFIMAPLFNDTEPKMIIGESGSGKTHLIRLLKKEMPIEIWDLDKRALIEDGIATYNCISNPNGPSAIVVDDLHYLLGAMNLYAHKSEGAEGNVIGLLSNFLERAKEYEATPIFVANDSLFGLLDRFEREEQKTKFLEMFKGCINSSDDHRAVHSRLNYRPEYGNTIDLNSRGFRYQSYPITRFNLHGENEKTGFLKLFPSKADEINTDFYGWLDRKTKNMSYQTINSISKTFGIADIPFFGAKRPLPHKDILKESESVLYYGRSKGIFDGLIRAEVSHYHKTLTLGTKNIRQLSSIRDLKQIYNGYNNCIKWENFRDDIRREKYHLGIYGRSLLENPDNPIDSLSEDESIRFSPNDLVLAEGLIRSKSNDLLGVGSRRLARVLAHSSNVGADMILSDLSVE